MPSDLSRFIEAQDMPYNGYEQAIGELRAGRKRSHWIWYIFPQQIGLSRSAMAQHFSIRDEQEAADYLRHPVLGGRYLEATAAAHEQLCIHGVPPERLMKKTLDAVKLRSSLELFSHTVRLHLTDDRRFDGFLSQADELIRLLPDASALSEEE